MTWPRGTKPARVRWVEQEPACATGTGAATNDNCTASHRFRDPPPKMATAISPDVRPYDDDAPDHALDAIPGDASTAGTIGYARLLDGSKSRPRGPAARGAAP